MKTGDLHNKHTVNNAIEVSHVAELRHSRYLCDDHINNTHLTCNVHHGLPDGKASDKLTLKPAVGVNVEPDMKALVVTIMVVLVT